METTYRAVVSLPSDTSIPADAAVNVWHFRGVNVGTSRAEDIQDIFTHLSNFYANIDNTFLASVVDGDDVHVEFFDLADPTPRVPLDDVAMPLTPSAGPDYPTEVAICLSFQAAPISGVPQGRRRGRVFIGPLASGISQTANGRVLLDTTEQNALVAAANLMLDDLITAGVPWAIYSPTTDAVSSLAAATFLVHDGWVDNAFDTMRSRGTDSTVRALFSV